LVATSDFPLQSNLLNRYIYSVHHVTDILHPPAYEDGTDKEFRNVGYKNSDAGELPKKEHITIETRRKLENKIILFILLMKTSELVSLLCEVRVSDPYPKVKFVFKS